MIPEVSTSHEQGEKMHTAMTCEISVFPTPNMMLSPRVLGKYIIDCRWPEPPWAEDLLKIFICRYKAFKDFKGAFEELMMKLSFKLYSQANKKKKK